MKVTKPQKLENLNINASVNLLLNFIFCVKSRKFWDAIITDLFFFFFCGYASQIKKHLSQILEVNLKFLFRFKFNWIWRKKISGRSEASSHKCIFKQPLQRFQLPINNRLRVDLLVSVSSDFSFCRFPSEFLNAKHRKTLLLWLPRSVHEQKGQMLLLRGDKKHTFVRDLIYLSQRTQKPNSRELNRAEMQTNKGEKFIFLRCCQKLKTFRAHKSQNLRKAKKKKKKL